MTSVPSHNALIMSSRVLYQGAESDECCWVEGRKPPPFPLQPYWVKWPSNTSKSCSSHTCLKFQEPLPWQGQGSVTSMQIRLMEAGPGQQHRTLGCCCAITSGGLWSRESRFITIEDHNYSITILTYNIYICGSISQLFCASFYVPMSNHHGSH